jgi:hypothetical protein
MTKVTSQRLNFIVISIFALVSHSARTTALEEPTQLYWGDTHVHTTLSGDAFQGGVRLSPEDAYRFARGEAVRSNSGQNAQLQRPLDFAVIADHGNNLGAAFARDRFQAEPDSALGQLWHMAIKKLITGHIDKAALKNGALLPAHRSWQISIRNKVFRQALWHRVTETADRYNEPGEFTAFIGYEWTPSFEEGYGEHRVVVFADDRSHVNQVLPFTSYDSANEEDLWSYLDRYELNTGGRVISIPHNSNLTSGAMFALKDSFGFNLTARYASIRARFEPIVEVTQIKGDSESHPFLSPDDAFADYETWDGWRGWATQDSVVREAMLPHEYARSALKLGLEVGSSLGINPFKFGMIGSTDSHTGLATADDDNFWGKSLPAEPSQDRMFNKIAAFNWQMNAAGYAGVWATANTRAAIFEAMLRKETYATTGPRITVRFFGGYAYQTSNADESEMVAIGYARGVPMGGDLPAPPPGVAPIFMIAASKDPLGANLDRVQIIKGWRSSDGQLQEKVFDVAVSNNRQPDGSGKLPEVGNTVDLNHASYTNTIGSPYLSTVWRDPDFDPQQPAFYYARVIQIPTPRWTLYDKVRFQISDIPVEIPLSTQERAYTSPIWYSPSGG